jgi:uncharacterized membrane protein
VKLFPLFDLIALACFVVAWGGYAIAMESTGGGKNSLDGRMHEFRELWMRRALERDLRMVDTIIMSSLMNGTAFFASTSLLAVGGVVTMLHSSDDLLSLLSDMPLGIHVTRSQWEAKAIGLVIILAYAFFKFAWSYRLFNYVAILFGAMPPKAEEGTPEAEAHVVRTTRMFETAGRHFNRGQRALFFALGYLGWFAGPYVLIATTVATVVVVWRRQFVSGARKAIVEN